MVVAVAVALPPPVSETAMVNETKGLKISWGNCHGGIILLTQPSFSSPQNYIANMFVNVTEGNEKEG